MAGLEWVKIVTNIFENPKLLLIDSRENPDTIITIWFKLMCLAGKCNNSGILSMADKALSEKEISSLIHRPAKKVHYALDIFIEYEMVGRTDNAYFICNWSKYQNTQKIEEQKAKNAEYQRVHRKKVSALCKDLRKPLCKGNVRGAEYSAIQSKEETPLQGGKEEDHPTVTLQPEHPSLETIRAFCKSSNLLHVLPERFFNHYSPLGWVRKNGTPVIDWQAEIRGWDAEDKSKGKPTASGNGKGRPDIHVDWYEDYRRSIDEEAPRS